MKQDATHTAMTFGGQTSRPNSDPHMLVFPCLQLLNYAYEKENSKNDVTVNCYMLSNKGMSYIPYLFYHILTQLLSFHVTKISPFLTHQCYIYIYISQLVKKLSKYTATPQDTNNKNRAQTTLLVYKPTASNLIILNNF
jgi:hypothetical protein